MKKIWAFCILILVFSIGKAQNSDYPTLKSAAEKYYAEGSYSRAYELYQKAASLSLPENEKRWVQFRLADTLWRSESATQTADTTKLEQAEQQLNVLVRDIQRDEDKDRVWAEVQESLGDYYWTSRNRNWGSGWTYYQQALDWWAGSADLDLARGRYLKIIWKASKPAWAEPFYYYGYYGNWVPLEVLENAAKIAKTPEEKAHAHYLIAVTLSMQYGDVRSKERVPEEFEAALKAGKTDWYDDALFRYAQFYSGYGRLLRMANGQYRQQPDYKKALELYQRLVSEFPKGSTRYYDQATQAIREITSPVLSLSISNIFLPDSEISFYVNWRNVNQIAFTLYRVNLNSAVQFTGSNDGSNNWVDHISLTSAESLKSWTKETKDMGDHAPGQDMISLDEKLSTGAYLIEAKTGNLSARDVILVSDASLILKTSGKQALAFFCDARNGSPISGASISLWEHLQQTDGKWNWHHVSQNTGQDGLTLFDLQKEANYGRDLFVSGSVDNRQAFSTGNSYYYYEQPESWRIYAYTDRPAYRPGDTMQWKFTARTYQNGSYSTPSNTVVEYEILDPRNSKVKEGKQKLNQFGSAWDSLDLTSEMPLGEYRVTFYDENRTRTIGGAVLFRLEEYKLPEFEVTIQTPEENGRKKAFVLGEPVEVNIQSDYYFGGAVANASVEVLVYQNPYYQWWFPEHEYPWFYEDINRQRYGYYGGTGPIIKRETLKTDETGKAKLTFDTPKDAGQDYEYRIEARVTDASRREITASDTVRVTRQRYYVYPTSDHCLYRPQDKVTVNFKSIDANRQPVQAEGTVKITRDYWYEIWLDPKGKEVKGEELAKMQEKVFPPAGEETEWKLKFRGYQHDELLTRSVKTDINGEAALNFTPERDGYYRIAWSSEDKL
ncbi:MAG: alpha-2-macroglobulin, partial [Acidobacteria bacterium]